MLSVKNVDRTEHCTYWHTGIVFDRAVAGRVAAVFPGSPAEQAGIRAGEQLTSYEPSPAGFDGLRNSFDRVADGLTKILTRHSNYADFQLTRTSGTQYTDKDGTGGGPVKILTIVGSIFPPPGARRMKNTATGFEFSVKGHSRKKTQSLSDADPDPHSRSTSGSGASLGSEPGTGNSACFRFFNAESPRECSLTFTQTGSTIAQFEKRCYLCKI